MDDEKSATTDQPSIADRVQAAAKKAAHKASEGARQAATDRLLKGQLALWRPQDRGIPNELVRCALFPARDRKAPRVIYPVAAPMVLPLIGGGKIYYFGEELRQEEETVWLQLVHMAKENCTETVYFSPHAFLKSIGWEIHSDSYERLLHALRRLSSGGVEVFSQRFNGGISAKLISKYAYSKDEGKLWSVRVFDSEQGMLMLFDKLYSRIDWALRLELPTGVATWLQAFFASHKEPFDHKIETLAAGAGLKLHDAADDALEPAKQKAKHKARLSEAKKLIIKGLGELKSRGFLTDFLVTPGNVVKVRRLGDDRPVM
jgi:hypothetical protein